MRRGRDKPAAREGMATMGDRRVEGDVRYDAERGQWMRYEGGWHPVTAPAHHCPVCSAAGIETQVEEAGQVCEACASA